jgi:hypothetical protein
MPASRNHEDRSTNACDLAVARWIDKRHFDEESGKNNTTRDEDLDHEEVARGDAAAACARRNSGQLGPPRRTSPVRASDVNELMLQQLTPGRCVRLIGPLRKRYVLAERERACTHRCRGVCSRGVGVAPDVAQIEPEPALGVLAYCRGRVPCRAPPPPRRRAQAHAGIRRCRTHDRGATGIGVRLARANIDSAPRDQQCQIVHMTKSGRHCRYREQGIRREVRRRDVHEPVARRETQSCEPLDPRHQFGWSSRSCSTSHQSAR